MREILPGGGGSSIVVVLAVLLTFWGLSGFYRVQADEQGVVLRFGKFLTQTSPGLNYHLPWPIESAITPKVTTVNRVDIGMRGGLEERRGSNGVTRDVPEESLMLTGDEISSMSISPCFGSSPMRRIFVQYSKPERHG